MTKRPNVTDKTATTLRTKSRDEQRVKKKGISLKPTHWSVTYFSSSKKKSITFKKSDFLLGLGHGQLYFIDVHQFIHVGQTFPTCEECAKFHEFLSITALTECDLL